MAERATDIQADIDAIKWRINTSANELDSRMLRLPRTARLALQYRRWLLVAHAVVAAVLWVWSLKRARSKSSGDD